MRAVLALSVMLLALLAVPRPAAASPESELVEAANAYARGDYPAVIKFARPLLYPQIRLSTQDRVVRAYKLLGISYIFEKDRPEAEKQFMAILSLRPDYRLDPLVDPVAAVEFLEGVKRRNAQKLKAILERERREAERRRIAEEQRRERERQRLLALAAPTKIVERTVIRRSWATCFVPFGVAQLSNGHRRKGYTLLAAETALGAVSLGALIGRATAYPDRVQGPDYERARALNIVQVTSGALFLGLVAYGVIDALVYHQPELVIERRYERKNGPGGAKLAPLVSIGERSATFGLSLRGDL